MTQYSSDGMAQDKSRNPNTQAHKKGAAAHPALHRCVRRRTHVEPWTLDARTSCDHLALAQVREALHTYEQRALSGSDLELETLEPNPNIRPWRRCAMRCTSTRSAR